jgi:hypothetical protein
MNKCSFLICCAIALFLSTPSEAQPYLSKVWVADNGDGTYKNPVLYADYSDPDAILVGDDFYLVSSSFNCVPGLPILHSKDLVNWEILGHVFTYQEPLDVFDKPQHGNGVWAPSIRYHNNIGFKAQLGPKKEAQSNVYLMPLEGDSNMQVTRPIVF